MAQTLSNLPIFSGVKNQITDSGVSLSSLSSSSSWISYSSVIPTRASADDPTYVLTFSGVDLTSLIGVGMKLKWTQNSTVRYGVCTVISFSTNTTLTLYGGTDYDVDDTATFAISNFNYSYEKSPLGFPLDITKWSVVMTDTNQRSQINPVAGTYYTNGNNSISIPIGQWHVSYYVSASTNTNTNTTATYWIALSTSSTSVSDTNLQCYLEAYQLSAAAVVFNIFREAVVTLTSKTTYYLINMSQQTIYALRYFGERVPTRVVCKCAYI